MKKLLALSLLALISVSYAEGKSQTYNLDVTEDGFVPSTLDVKPNTEIILNITRKTDSTCATQINIPSKKISKELPLNKTVNINLGKLEKGDVKFACGMDMITGVIHVK